MVQLFAAAWLLAIANPGPRQLQQVVGRLYTAVLGSGAPAPALWWQLLHVHLRAHDREGAGVAQPQSLPHHLPRDMCTQHQ